MLLWFGLFTAGVAKLVDALVSKTSVFGRAGSNPVPGVYLENLKYFENYL